MIQSAKKKVTDFFDTIFGDSESFSFENRLFNISTSVGFFICLAMILTNLLVGIANMINIGMASLGILYIILFYYGRFRNEYRKLIPIYIISTQFLLLMGWVFNSGSYGPVSFIFIAFLLVTIGIVPSNQHIKWFMVVTFTYLTAFGIEVFLPNAISGYSNNNQRIVDIILTFFIAFGFAYFFIRVLKINYAQEHTMAVKQKQLIEIQNAYLENANLIKDRLFTVLAHDLRSPLSSLKSMLSAFEDEIKENNDMHQITKVIDQRLTYNLQLLDDLMLWSKSQLTGGQMTKVRFKLLNVLNDSIDVLMHAADEKSIVITNEVNPEIYIDANMNSVRAIIRNLISNAIKFSPDNSEVKIYSEESDHSSHIIVKDNGVGLTKKQISELFTQHHFSSEGTRNERGSGLGLLLVKDFVVQNGGEIKIESEPGKGTAVILTWPKEPVLEVS